MITAAQARAAEVSRVDLNRLIADGIVERVEDADGVYRLAGSPEDPDLDALRAAWLQLGGGRTWDQRMRRIDAVVSHRSAAHARGLGDLIPTTHDFYVDRRRRLTRSDTRLRVRPTMRISWSAVAGLPVSSVEQIVGDLLADREDESAIATIVRDAMHEGVTTRASLSSVVAGHARAYGDRPDAMTDRLLGPGAAA
jgi:hypothetical protein